MTDLNSSIYNETSIRGNKVRVGVLAALLRVADEVDYNSNRILLSHFRMYQGRLLKAPTSLGHWIKHYYAQSVDPPDFIRVNRGVKPIFPVTMVYPKKEFEKLLREYVEESNGKITRADVVKKLGEIGFASPEIRFKSKVAGVTNLPDKIEKERSGRPLDEL